MRMGPVVLCSECRHFKFPGACHHSLRNVIDGGQAPESPIPAHTMRYSGPCGYTGNFWMPIRNDEEATK